MPAFMVSATVDWEEPAFGASTHSTHFPIRSMWSSQSKAPLPVLFGEQGHIFHQRCEIGRKLMFIQWRLDRPSGLVFLIFMRVFIGHLAGMAFFVNKNRDCPCQKYVPCVFCCDLLGTCISPTGKLLSTGAVFSSRVENYLLSWKTSVLGLARRKK